MIYFFILSVAFIISFLITPSIRYVALKFYVIDKRNNRKIHKKLVTKLGGLAIYFGILGGISLLVLLDLNFLRPNLPFLLSLVVCSTLMLLLGIYDDFQGSGAFLKFIIQIIIASLAIKTGFILTRLQIGNLVDINLGVLSIPLTIAWLVGITNATNLLDGLDGLAAGVIAIASFFIFFSGLILGDRLVMFVSLAIIGANLAFLHYNFYPAKIFMGDTGSLFLGFLMACLGIFRSNADTHNKYFFPMILVMLVPILDTFFAIVRRILKKQYIFLGDSSHFHHYYIKQGFTQAQTVRRFYLMTFALGIIMIIFVAVFR